MTPSKTKTTKATTTKAKKKKTASKAKKAAARNTCLSFRVNAEEKARIEAAIPAGGNKNNFLRDLTLAAIA